VAERAGTELDAFTPAADGTIDGTTRFAFDEPATAGFVLVWITGLVPSDGGFAADIAEVEVQAAG
jgi:eukaryotic-like serine/threonine-protein kinase